MKSQLSRRKDITLIISVVAEGKHVQDVPRRSIMDFMVGMIRKSVPIQGGEVKFNVGLNL